MLGSFSLGIFRFPDGRLIFRLGKLIIGYNKFHKTAENATPWSGSRAADLAAFLSLTAGFAGQIAPQNGPFALTFAPSMA
jgi:hypothetical protein